MLQIQYRGTFKFRPTLLISGAAADVAVLWEIFTNWNGDEFDLVERLRRGAEVALHGVKNISLSRAKAERDSYLEWEQGRGIWCVSRRGQPRIAGMLEALKDSSEPSHQYLDIGDPNGVQIMCSKDEYPPEQAAIR